jgi:hypothetical protein
MAPRNGRAIEAAAFEENDDWTPHWCLRKRRKPWMGIARNLLPFRGQRQEPADVAGYLDRVVRG